MYGSLLMRDFFQIGVRLLVKKSMKASKNLCIYKKDLLSKLKLKYKIAKKSTNNLDMWRKMYFVQTEQKILRRKRENILAKAY